MYDRVLVPTDGSEPAEAAIEHAVAIAERFGATLHALYVVDTTSYATLEANAEMLADALEAQGERAVDRVREAANVEDIPVIESVVTGSVFRSILEYADDEDVDMIVMGTHGRQGIDRYLLGSVTERIVRRADQPVLTVRAAGSEEE